MVGGRGFNLAWAVKDASKHFRVPQRRRRLFLVCDFAGPGQRSAQVLFVTKSLSGYFAARAGEEERTAAAVGGGSGGARRGGGAVASGGVSLCGGKGEAEACQRHNPDLVMCAGSPQAKASMLVNQCPTVASVAHKNGPYMVHPEICGTLCASGAGMSRPAGMESETDLCVAVDCRNLNETAELSGTLQSKYGGGYSLNYQNPVRTGYVIRRLTPIECERLMSLPSGYTEYGHDGRRISDSSRYQLLGNSIVVNVLAYIMQNIAESMGAGDDNGDEGGI
jgi:site-specific DNA-cytosine methylase